MNANVVGSGDIGEILTKMLSDPESLGKVMNMVGALSASGALGGLSHETPKNGDVPPKTEEVSHSREKETAFVPPKKQEIPCKERPKINQCDRIRLLEAMRPFLSDEKRVKLDTVIKLLGLAEAAGGLCSLKR